MRSAVVYSTMPSPNDTCDLDELLVATGTGDEHAFSQLYDALAPQVLGICQHILADRAKAEEVTQEVFMEVWRTALRFDPGKGRAASWVMRIAHHRAVDTLRAHLATLHRDDREATLARFTPSRSVEDEALSRVAGRDIRSAVESIGEPHATAVALTYFAGLTNTELAEYTGVPLGTAKTRVRDGMKKLSAVLRGKERK